MSAKHSIRFSGELATPIAGSDLYEAFARTRSSEATSEDWEALNKANRSVQMETERKISLLAEHYEVSDHLPSEAMILFTLIELARDFVPGFRVNVDLEVTARRGRPRTIPLRMIYDFMKLRQQGMGTSDAIRRLKSKGPWKGMIPHGLNARYNELERRGGLAELARKFEENDGETK